MHATTLQRRVELADEGRSFPSSGMPTESDLRMPRLKARSIAVSLAYRAARIGRLILGPHRVLRSCLACARIFNRLAFELSGEIYGEHFHCSSLAMSEDVLRKWIPEGGSVVDLGCGTGRWCRVASRYAKRVVGIDFDAGNLKQAQRLTSQPHIQYVSGNVSTSLNDQLGNETFDIALLSHVLEHVDDVDLFLKAIHRIAPVLAVDVPDFESDSLNVVRRELNLPFFSDGDHVREYTLAILIEQLSRNGWNVRYHSKRGGTVMAIATAADYSPSLSDGA